MSEQPKTMPFEAILQALCSQVTLRQSNDAQDVYGVGDRIEAKLACDALAAHGFDAKLYHEDAASALYIKRPADSAALESRLAATLAYADALKHLKSEMDTLRDEDAEALGMADYSMSFTNIPATGVKQITVQISPVANAAQAPAVSAAQPSPAASAPRPAAAQAANNKRLASQKIARKKQRQQEKEEFTSGSSLAKRNYPSRLETKKDEDGESFWKPLYLYVRGNMATGVTGVFVLVIVPMLIAFTMFVLLKSFLCPDLATVKNSAWYCGQQADDKKPQP